MAKLLRLTQDDMKEILRDFATMIKKAKVSDGKISYSKSFGSVDRKAVLKFTETAWLKMTSLVREFDKEIAWNGVARRGDDGIDDYIISDILVYPQFVTGITVEDDEEKDRMWRMELDDEVFNNLRMQGHSHVNMGVSPSGTDTELYSRLLEQCRETDFYIFLIWNKRGEKTIKIYDFAKNVLFETSDCTVEIIPDKMGIEVFLEDARKMVRDKVYKPAVSAAKKETKAVVPKEPETTPAKSSGKKGKRKGKRNKDKPSTYNGYKTSDNNKTQRTGIYDTREDDDDGYPYYGYDYGYHDRYYNW